MRLCKNGDGQKHYGRGLCRTCYMREYRKDGKGTTMANLRRVAEECKMQLDSALDVGREEVAEYINEFLQTLEVESSCRYRDGELRIRIGDKRGEWKF